MSAYLPDTFRIAWTLLRYSLLKFLVPAKNVKDLGELPVLHIIPPHSYAKAI